MASVPLPSGTVVTFEDHRPRLFGIAYRMLGTVADAEDVVQEAYLRWHAADRSSVRSSEAWLVSVTTRLSIDQLRRSATERRAYTGDWLPEPIVTPAPEPKDASGLASELSTAFLLLLERLAPEERAAFLLREVFDTEYAEIARVVDRSEAACRQMVHRARERIRSGRPRFAAEPSVRRRLLSRFLTALEEEDPAALLAVIGREAVCVNDSGGKVKSARRAIVGNERLARYFLVSSRKFGPLEHRIAWINGEPGLLTFRGGELISAISVEVDGEEITRFFRVSNPEKLRRVEALGPAV